MQHKNITFIGSGNMARSIVLGMLNNFYPHDKITMSNRSPEKLKFYSELELNTSLDNVDAAKGAEVIVLAIKPHQVQEVCEQIKDSLTEGVLVLSVAAGITTEFISQCLGGKYAVVRAMPNMGSAVSAGVTGVFADDNVTPDQEELVEAIFSAISMIVWLEDEDLVPVVTAVSGSGIAYYFRIMEIMEQEAVNLGLPKEVAKLMVAQTALGAAKLALESEDDLVTLRKAVVSPGGTTESALKSMDAANLETVLGDGMRAALNRSQEMAEELCRF
jgi:pyrroline-5-carboxylate reductase